MIQLSKLFIWPTQSQRTVLYNIRVCLLTLELLWFQLTTSMKYSVKHTASQNKFQYNIVKSTVSCLHHNPQKKGKFSEFLSCGNVIFSDHLFPCHSEIIFSVRSISLFVCIHIIWLAWNSSLPGITSTRSWRPSCAAICVLVFPQREYIHISCHDN